MRSPDALALVTFATALLGSNAAPAPVTIKRELQTTSMDQAGGPILGRSCSEIPPYHVVTTGSCQSHGLIDIFDEPTCRAVLNDGYYNSRDQDGNGIIDAFQNYPFTFTNGAGTPPGCWPVDPAIGSFPVPFPVACINPDVVPGQAECSDIFPCFCKVPDFVVVKSGSCQSNGYIDIFNEEHCRAVMNQGYYNTRDQDGNGMVDATQRYAFTFVNGPGTPPGCWPVDPAIGSFPVPFPVACINPDIVANQAECSDIFPCFCKPTMMPAALPAPTCPDLPSYHVVKSGTCQSQGLIDIFDEATCRAVMNDGYYNSRDQDGNGIIDAFQNYPFTFTNGAGTPPGCWPVDPAIGSFPVPFPVACINPDVVPGQAECSDIFPCFCKVPEFAVVKSGSCQSNGYTDIFGEEHCRAVMNQGYYNTRDQDSNGMIDATQRYAFTFVNGPGTPPGCWPVDPAIGSFPVPFPVACINPDIVANQAECSDIFPCFCEKPMQMGKTVVNACSGDVAGCYSRAMDATMLASVSCCDDVPTSMDLTSTAFMPDADLGDAFCHAPACGGMVTGPQLVTFAQAVEHCESKPGQRLCTVQELRSKLCCSEGCSGREVWSLGSCSLTS